MERIAIWFGCAFFATTVLGGERPELERRTGDVAAQSEVIYPKAYDGFQASRDAQAFWDARREDALNRQLGWNEALRWRAAAAQSNTLYYAPYAPPVWNGPWRADETFWPYGAGRIFGFGYYEAIRQPVGRREVQTGPNRWESFPIYAEDVEQPAIPLAPPKVEVPAPTPCPRGQEF